METTLEARGDSVARPCGWERLSLAAPDRDKDQLGLGSVPLRFVLSRRTSAIPSRRELGNINICMSLDPVCFLKVSIHDTSFSLRDSVGFSRGVSILVSWV